ncbi:uncharacterized protein LOC128987769 [Macrosteles quadrilineatus]|uniref:uncharacterized protein LOC128987769 n=1 Tax=Macrosteles quadrilineatus TaxID=74068 RepID=UPI0023E0E540|nr:uncharacterized protein LOC128987769 [Macrosteles quadrilineatus]
MAGYSCIIILFATQFGISAVSAVYHPNHRYNFESEVLTIAKNESGNEYKFNLSMLNHINPSNQFSSQLRSPLSKESPEEQADSETEASERKFMIHGGQRYSKISPKGKRRFENFVTPKTEGSKKGYEVTTKKFVDTEPENDITSSALNVDNDVAIALDEDIDQEDEPETSRPGKVYLDSYGRLHGGTSHRGHGFGYGVVHSKKPSHHHTTGRVKMQVFRGPTRIVGHKKFAPWGYFVVQPADNGGPHQYPGPPYYY